MQRLVEYIARCPFSLARMITRTREGKVIYRAAHPTCVAFPQPGGLQAGNPRNFEIYDPLEFLANVTQHIPNTAHGVRLGWW